MVLLSMPSDTNNSGIYVVEGPAQGQPIPVDGDSVTAFVGPTPRGPVDHAVKINSPDDFLKNFGVPECHCRLEFSVRQFFANGGRNAVVVRVSGTSVCHRIRLRAGAEELVLEARNPGPLEYLRASVDYDGIDAEDETCFNLVVQRLRSPGSAWIDTQEYYRAVSIDPGSRDYLGYILSQSDLIKVVGQPPVSRPAQTYKPCTVREAGYVEVLMDHVDSPPPSDYDLIGSATDGTGLNALEHIPDIGQVVLLSGAEGAPLGPVALLAADRFCRSHQSLLIIDPPARWVTVEDVLADQERSGFASPNAITWFPGVRVRNLQGEKVLSSAAGSIAAALISGDRRDGVLQLHAEGPVMLRAGVRLTAEIDDDAVHRLTRAGVNTLVQRSALHLQLQGNVTQARYGSISADWNELEMRRQVLFILRRIRSGTRWTFFKDSNQKTWQELKDQIGEFLSELHARSILVGESSHQSFYIKCDADTNADHDGKIGEINFIVGFAIRQAGEFLVFRFHRHQGLCRVSELGGQSGLERTG
jgi:hypothetical protein